MIETHDLSKRYQQFEAVDGVNLSVQAGQVLALLGPNGAGKTTTVRMLTALLSPTRGWARVAGHDTVREAAQVRACVGVLTEGHGLYNRMTADQYLDFFGQIYRLDRTYRQTRARLLLEAFGLWPHRKRRVGEYSKGMRQKLALARALLHEPPVLLLDEPTSAMDPEAAHRVRDVLKALRTRDRAVVLCTHNLAEAEEMADEIAVIRRGHIVAQGTPADLKQSLLGPPEYELHLAAPASFAGVSLPPNVRVTAQGPDWLRLRVPNPGESNPLLLSSCLAQGLPVVSLHETPRSLEQVYLTAMQSKEPFEAAHGN